MDELDEMLDIEAEMAAEAAAAAASSMAQVLVCKCCARPGLGLLVSYLLVSCSF